MIDIPKLQRICVDALEDIKARDIEVFDVREQTAMFDRVILATAESARQGRALANNLREKVKTAGAKVYGVEGEDPGDWVLIDLGDMVIHIMQPAMRMHYNLEELWGAKKARVTRTPGPGEAMAKARAKAAKDDADAASMPTAKSVARSSAKYAAKSAAKKAARKSPAKGAASGASKRPAKKAAKRAGARRGSAG